MFKVWNGGRCPVNRGELVDVIHRDGEIFYKQDPYEEGSKATDWTVAELESNCDIIAWRPSEETK